MSSDDARDELFGGLFRQPWLRRLVQVRSSDLDGERRGGMLIFICALAILLTLVLSVEVSLSGMGSPVAYATLTAAVGLYALAIAGAKLGYINVAGLGVSTAISVISVIIPLSQQVVNGGLIYVLVGLFIASFALRPLYIWVVVALNLCLLACVGYVSADFITQLPKPMRSVVTDLALLNLGIGFVGWLNAMFNGRVIDHLTQTRLELERSHIEEHEAMLARELAEQASAAKSTFLATMSHELRTPLNAIIGYANLIEEDLDDLKLEQGQVRDDLKKINNAGKHLLTLINDVLDLSRVEAGRMTIFIEEVDISQLLTELSGIISPLMVQNQNTFRLEHDPRCQTLHTDRTKLRQILLNLISNAAKFTTSGTIVLRVEPVERAGARVMRFEVEDEGIGMDEATLKRVFEDFVQADSSTTRQYGGTGLGLALVQRLLAMLEGNVSVTSTPSRGSCFVVELPERLEGARAQLGA